MNKEEVNERVKEEVNERVKEYVINYWWVFWLVVFVFINLVG